MKKILVPIDGTCRSKKSLDFILEKFSKDDFEITLINIGDVSEIGFSNIPQSTFIDEKLTQIKEKSSYILDQCKKKLPGYEVKKCFLFGNPGKEIVSKSIDHDFDIIVMTKSTKKNFIDSIGSVTQYVVKKAKCIVIIVPEEY